jgi:3-dehydroquinate synthase
MKIIQQHFNVSFSFPVIFTSDVFNTQNPSLYNILSESGQKRNRILVIIDSHVFKSTTGLSEKIDGYAKHYEDNLEFVTSPFIIRGGEICKREPIEIEKIHEIIDRLHLCRHSFIMAIGGGAVLDAAGYAAATSHRGIRLIRMPTTTLAQNDAGVGVKNGVNAFGRKNFLGTFSPPFAVINDFDFLKTLPKRDLRAGIAEAVKVALIKDRTFFDFLYKERHTLSVFTPDIMKEMIIRCAELHLEHIRTSGDPFEYGTSRPLDFGHWSAHKIEEMTDSEINHGEAVAIGIALDSLYSHYSGLISEIELHRILSILEDIGFDLYHWSLKWINVADALREFQEHLGGELNIPLLNGIGNKIEVNRIDTALLKQCIGILAERNNRKESTHVRREKPDVGKGYTGHLLY